jgi:hypothetical protein
MMLPLVVILVLAGFAAVGVGILFPQWRRRGLGSWCVTYLQEIPRRRAPSTAKEFHLLLCIGDHFEPQQGRGPSPAADACIRRWVEDYPRQFDLFRDSDGRPPRHTFFYPIEEYDPAHLDALAGLCRDGFGEVEVHLHHDHDTAEGLRQKLLQFKEVLAERHGLLSIDRITGGLCYGFIHGNWALDNSREDGRWCGVNNELDVLRETGCYADFTMPSAPGPAQTRKINGIYYAIDDPLRPKSHDSGINVGTSVPPEGALLLIQGPLILDWRRRKWGVVPRLENGALQASQPPRIERLGLWLKARVQVPTRPDWFFVKLHAHGAAPRNHETMLGAPMVGFHQALAQYAAGQPHFHYHYVTAREMYNLVRAAEAGWQRTVAEARDFRLVSRLPTQPASSCQTLIPTNSPFPLTSPGL